MRIDSSGIVRIGDTTAGYENNDSRLNIIKAASGGTENPLLTLWNPTTVADARAGIDFLTNNNSGSGRDGAFIRGSNDGSTAQAHIQFGTISNETYTEKIRFQTAGGISFNGDTAAANALDDYEEGNWTPSFNANISTSTVTAIYTIVGRKVTAQFYVSTPGTFGQAAGAADTSLIISGLPYAASGNAFHTGVIDVGNGGAAGAYLRVSGGASTMSVLVGSGSIGTARTHLRGNTIGKGDYVIGSITYQTS